MLHSIAGGCPCAWMNAGTRLRDHSAAAALGLEARVLSVIQKMDSLLKTRTTRKGVVRQHFEMVFHCCAVTKSYFWKPEFYCTPLPVGCKDCVTQFYYVYTDPKLSPV